MKAHIADEIEDWINQEYIERTTKIDMDSIHSTLNECRTFPQISRRELITMINESLKLIEKYR